MRQGISSIKEGEEALRRGASRGELDGERAQTSLKRKSLHTRNKASKKLYCVIGLVLRRRLTTTTDF